MTATTMPTAPTVLVVGGADAPETVSGAVLLQHGFAAVQRVDTIAEAVALLRKSTFDLVILPIGSAGPEELSVIEHDIRPAAPFIIGTAADATQELILGALRAGIPEFVPAPIQADEFDVAIRRLLRRMAPAQRMRGTVVAVYCSKGGLGTTTVAVTIAAALAKAEPSARVALVDFVVVGGDVRVMLDLKPAYDIGDLVMKIDRIDGELLSSLMTTGPGGMLILPSSDRPEVQDLIEGTATSTILAQLRAHFQYVVLDLDHYLGERTIGALDIADRVVLVTQLSVPALRAGFSFQAAMKFVGEEMAPPIGEEFATFYDEQRLGLDVRDALLDLQERIDTLDIKMFVTSLLIQRETGGNLSEILTGLSTLIRDRAALRDQIDTLTAEPKLTGTSLAALPLLAFAVIMLLNRPMMQPMFDTDTGRYTLMFASGILVLGFVMMRQIARIDT